MAIKYKWLKERLKILIEKSVDSGIIRLPTEADLCDRYKVSRQTVRQALSLLEKEGLIEKRQGSGSYITGLSSLSEQNIIELMLPTDSEYIYPKMLYELRSRLLTDGLRDGGVILHDENTVHGSPSLSAAMIAHRRAGGKPPEFRTFLIFPLTANCIICIIQLTSVLHE